MIKRHYCPMNQSIVRIKFLSFTRIQGCFKLFFFQLPPKFNNITIQFLKRRMVIKIAYYSALSKRCIFKRRYFVIRNKGREFLNNNGIISVTFQWKLDRFTLCRKGNWAQKLQLQLNLKSGILKVTLVMDLSILEHHSFNFLKLIFLRLFTAP